MAIHTSLIVLCAAAALAADIGYASPSTAPTTRPLAVIVAAGQSNMVGRRSSPADLPPEMARAHESILVFDGARWTPMDLSAAKEGFGPEVSCALELHKALGEPIEIIKHSVGGTGMGHWSPKAGGNLYRQLVARVDAAKKTRDIRLIGMIWMQGAADARRKDTAAAYGENLRSLIDSSRREMEAAQMPFVAGRINPVGDRYVDVPNVRRAIETCDAPRYAWADCDDLEKHSDQVHYTTKGLLELGKRFAAAILKMDKLPQGRAQTRGTR